MNRRLIALERKGKERNRKNKNLPLAKLAEPELTILKFQRPLEKQDTAA
jgi:hypothetical protein